MNVLHITPATNGYESVTLLAIPKENQYNFVKDFKMEPFVKLYLEE
jgi:hypothetical protein